MDYKIRNTYEVTQPQEVSVDWKGNNFLIIYGQHINGGFIAIPNWGISTEAGTPEDVFYNTEKLMKNFNHEMSKAIAEAINEHWESIEKTAYNSEKSTAELSEEAEKDRFTAKEWDFQGEPGYMVSQFHNGEKAVEQFIPKSSYKFFCDAIGVQPEIISGQEDKTRKPHSAEHIHEREER